MAHIGFDLDNVLYPLEPELRQYFSDLGFIHDGTSPSKWDLWTEYGLTETQFWTFFARGIRDGGLLVNGDPHPEAVDVVSQFLADGHHIYTVTSRNIAGAEFEARYATFKWIYEKLPVPWSGVIVSANKAILPFYSFIDDYNVNLEALRGTDLTIPVAYDQPWNRDWEGERAFSLWDYYDIVTESLG